MVNGDVKVDSKISTTPDSQSEAHTNTPQSKFLQGLEDSNALKFKSSAFIHPDLTDQTSVLMKRIAKIRHATPASYQLMDRAVENRATEQRNTLRKSTSSLPSPPFVESDVNDKVESVNDVEAMTSELISTPSDQVATSTRAEELSIDSMSNCVVASSEDTPAETLTLMTGVDASSEGTPAEANNASMPSIQHIPRETSSSTSLNTETSTSDPIQTSPNEWSIDNVITWLITAFNISDTAVLDAFRDNDIDGHVLLTAVNDAALKDDLKVKSFGKRARILQAINRLKNDTTNEYETSSSEDDIQYSPRRRKRKRKSESKNCSVRPSKRHQHGPIRRMDIQEVKDEIMQVPDGNEDLRSVILGKDDLMNVPDGNGDLIDVQESRNEVNRRPVEKSNLQGVIDELPSLLDNTFESSPQGTKRKRAVLYTMPFSQATDEDANMISTIHENIAESSTISRKSSSRRQLPDASENQARRFKVVKGLLQQSDTTDTSLEQSPRISQAINNDEFPEPPQGYSWAGLLQKYMDCPPGELLPVYGESDDEMVDSELEREMEEDVIAEQERAERLQRKRELRQARRDTVNNPDPVHEHAENNLNVEIQTVDNSEGHSLNRPAGISEIESSEPVLNASHIEADTSIASGPQPRSQPIQHTPVTHTSMGGLSAEEARNILDECISSFRQDWFVDRLPREEAQAHRVWKREVGRELDIQAELDHLEEKRLLDQKEAILANEFNSDTEIIKQAKALEPTVHSICRLEWILELISMPQPQRPPKPGHSKTDTVSTVDETMIEDDVGATHEDMDGKESHDQIQDEPDLEIEPEEHEMEAPDDDEDMADFIVEDDDEDEDGIAGPPLTARDRIIDKARATRRVSSESSKSDAGSKSGDNLTATPSVDTPAETRSAGSGPSTPQSTKPRMIAKKTVPRKQPAVVPISSDDEQPSVSNESQHDKTMETDSDSAFPPANTVLERSIKKKPSMGSSSHQETPTAKPRRSAIDLCADKLVESMLNKPSPELVAFVTSGRKMEANDEVLRDALRILREQYKTWSTTIRPSKDFLESEDDPMQDLKAFARYYLSTDGMKSAPPLSSSQDSPRSQPKNKSNALVLRPTARLPTAKNSSTPTKSPKGTERNDTEVVELSSDDDEDGVNNTPSQLTTRKPLRLPKATKRRRHKDYAGPVEKSTKQAQERQKRQDKAIAQRIQKQQRAGQTFEMEGSIMINPGHKLGEDDVWIIPSLSKALKPHQIEGVKFLWKNIIMIGNGCILAHDMGLGKTLQVITFIVTLMREITYDHPVPNGLKPARILILCPPSVIDNWCNEFEKWIPLGSELWDDGVRSVSKLDSFQNSTAYNREESRLDQLEAWYETGGIFVMSYDKYKSNVLNCGKYRLLEDQMERVNEYLVSPGPSAVICDEGHILRNKDGKLLEAVRKMSTKSRICLTGYPVQNNLLEYWAMLDFAHPGYLGSDMSFQYRFVYPISDGMYEDSTPQEKKTMHRKTFILNGIVGAKVSREDISVLKDILPSKTEYRIQVALTDAQRELYNAAVQDMANRVAEGISSTLFANAAVVQAICNHPGQLAKKMEAHAKRYRYRPIDRQLAIEAAPTVDSPANEDGTPEGTLPLENSDQMTYAWAAEILGRIPDIHAGTLSNKIVITMNIIRECQRSGEKILFFCHTHAILDLMELLLNAEPNLNYMRFDGKTVVNQRQSLISKFNTSENCSVFLLSTRATSLGVNIASASRVILFDIHWNPSHEAQAIGRAYRLGQQKPVVVYRISTWGTFETKMSEQAELKQHLAARVVDQRNTKHRINRDATRYFVPVPPTPTHVESVEQSILTSIDDEEVKATFHIDPVLLGALQGRNDILTDVRVSEITNAPTFDFSEAELAAMLEEIERNKEGIYDDVHELNDTTAGTYSQGSQRQGPAPTAGASSVIGDMMQYAANVMDQVMKNVNA